MTRYIITTLFAIGIILLYQLIDINLFTIDLPRRVSNNLFTSFNNNPSVDTKVIICNTGKLEIEEVILKIDTLLKFEPKIIGINLCDFDKNKVKAFGRFADNKRIVTSGCGENNKGQLGRLIEDNNVVTHFRSNKPDYFENSFPIRGTSLKKEIITLKEFITEGPLGIITNLS